LFEKLFNSAYSLKPSPKARPGEAACEGITDTKSKIDGLILVILSSKGNPFDQWRKE
jgi:hypothetical protein